MFESFIEEEIIREEIVEDELMFGTRRRRGSSGFRPGYGGGLGIDITDGDIVENFGGPGSIGIDVDPFSPDFGDLEFEVAPGIDIPF